MNPAKIPEHIAIIMDGNGRWAERRGLSRLDGHRQGAIAVREVVRACREIGVRYLTLFAFSTENWGRPVAEVHALMALLEDYLLRERDEILGNQIRLTAIGELWRIPESVRGRLATLMDESKDNRGMTLCLALSYGGQEELVDAMRALAREVARGRLAPDEIDARAIQERLWSHALPDPDLIIRTSGEMRISNFFLWELAYTELYFTDVPWPDFGRAELLAAIEDFGRRERRFGLLGEARRANGS
jgi:undecaprenyl diphosphate synthase